MGFFRLYLLSGILHVIACQSAAFRERQFSKKTGVLYQSPYSGPEVTSCSGRPCTALLCSRACLEEDGCVVFNHNEANAACVLSGRPDYDPANHETSNSEWNTYYTECPVKKGYVLYNNHQPPLCLRLDKRVVLQPVAKSLCRQEQANLVRVKTLDIYDIVKDLLTNADYLQGFVYIGAEDTAVEGHFVWNDGTSLTRGTPIWRHPSEGYRDEEDCTAVSATVKIVDTFCTGLAKAFVCQYDI